MGNDIFNMLAFSPPVGQGCPCWCLRGSAVLPLQFRPWPLWASDTLHMKTRLSQSAAQYLEVTCSDK